MCQDARAQHPSFPPTATIPITIAITTAIIIIIAVMCACVARLLGWLAGWLADLAGWLGVWLAGWVSPGFRRLGWKARPGRRGTPEEFGQKRPKTEHRSDSWDDSLGRILGQANRPDHSSPPEFQGKGFAMHKIQGSASPDNQTFHCGGPAGQCNKESGKEACLHLVLDLVISGLMYRFIPPR